MESGWLARWTIRLLSGVMLSWALFQLLGDSFSADDHDPQVSRSVPWQEPLPALRVQADDTVALPSAASAEASGGAVAHHGVGSLVP